MIVINWPVENERYCLTAECSNKSEFEIFDISRFCNETINFFKIQNFFLQLLKTFVKIATKILRD